MLLTRRKISLPAPRFPFRLSVGRVVKPAFVKKNHTRSPDLFGQGAIIHITRMLTNTLVVLLGQWCRSSEHIPVKQPPEGSGDRGQQDQMVPLIPGSQPWLCAGPTGSRSPAAQPAQKACGLLFFNCLFLRNISKAIFFS